jgi:mannose-6-phosphate isomerase-like protein (cupin superfamily)
MMLTEHTASDVVDFAGLTARFMQSGEAVSILEHNIAPGTLAAPLHRHAHEDEYSYVLHGEVGFQVGDEIRYAGPGELVAKPRGEWHAFWNRASEPAKVLEIVAPGGFENYFREIAPLLPPNVPAPDMAALAEIVPRYGLEMDFDSIAVISAREGLPCPLA